MTKKWHEYKAGDKAVMRCNEGTFKHDDVVVKSGHSDTTDEDDEDSIGFHLQGMEGIPYNVWYLEPWQYGEFNVFEDINSSKQTAKGDVLSLISTFLALQGLSYVGSTWKVAVTQFGWYIQVGDITYLAKTEEKLIAKLKMLIELHNKSEVKYGENNG